MKGTVEKLIWGILSLVVLASIYLVIVLGTWFIYQDRVYPGVSVAGISLSGLSHQEATDVLGKESKKYLSDDVFYISGKKISKSELGLSYNIEKTVSNALEAVDSSFSLGEQVDLPFVVDYDKKKLYAAIDSFEESINRKVNNASINADNGQYVFKEGRPGRRLSYGSSFYSFITATGNLKNQMNLVTNKIPPVYSAPELEEIFVQIKNDGFYDLTLTNGRNNYSVSKEKLLNFVELPSQIGPFVKRYSFGRYFSILEQDKAEVTIFSYNAIASFLGELAKEIEKEPVNAVLGVMNDMVVIKSSAKSGISLDIDESTKNILSSLSQNKRTARLTTRERKALISKETIADLGIREIVATGYSNFAGSPANRRHNIRVGAEKFNGLLIEPGETFSFTANLGDVDAANGYLPELVIKNNETTPEYGGGLCQVSTTAFRAALNGGLPILARKAHSYPVSYYRPYGTDATIYVPNPDLKFANNTRSHILVQTRITGNFLYFEFFGTKKEISVKFAGNKNAIGAVPKVEWVTPYTFDAGKRGPGSFKALIYRFLYDNSGKLIEAESYLSNYDSPDKYPH